MSHRPHSVSRVVFGKTGWAIDFVGLDEVVQGVRSVFRGWNIRTGAPASLKSFRPRARISKTAGGYDWQERGAPKAREWDSIPPRTPMRVITDVHDAAIYWYLAENPSLLCLHGAAVRIGKALVCFPARGRTGKSVLAACFAAHGFKVFADDVIGLDGNRGMALGFLPRLRAALPERLGSMALRYVETHRGPADDDWIYLKPRRNLIANMGEKAPISSFVLLNRLDGGRAAAGPARTVDVLKFLIAENIIRQLPMPKIYHRLHRLAVSTERLSLSYSDPNEAVALLAERFGG